MSENRTEILAEFKDHSDDSMEVTFFSDKEMTISVDDGDEQIIILSPARTAAFLVWCQGVIEKFKELEKQEDNHE